LHSTFTLAVLSRSVQSVEHVLAVIFGQFRRLHLTVGLILHASSLPLNHLDARTTRKCLDIYVSLFKEDTDEPSLSAQELNHITYYRQVT